MTIKHNYIYGKLSDFKNEAKKLCYNDYMYEVPKDFWHIYEDCEVVLMLDSMTAKISSYPRLIPYVPLFVKMKGKEKTGIKDKFLCLDYDYKKVYFISKDFKLTRNANESIVIWAEECSIQETCTYLDYNIPLIDGEPYKHINIVPLWEAQEFIDTHYPLPRKPISKKVREQVYKMFDGHCAYCGKPIDIKEMQVDHIVSHMNHCGEDNIDNYYPACSLCNRVKSDRTLEQFRKDIVHRGEIHRNRKKPVMADSDKIAIAYGIDKEDKPVTFYFEKKGQRE